MSRCEIIEKKGDNSFQLAIWHVEESEQRLRQMCYDIKINSNVLQQIETYRSSSRRIEIYATYLLLYSMRPQYNLLIEHNTEGKPSLEDCNISISHTKGYVAIMISKTNIVGVDIEYMSNRVEKVEAYFLRDNECATNLIDKLVQWCAKETAFKYFSMQTLQLIDFKSEYKCDDTQEKSFTVINTVSNKRITVSALIRHDYVLTYTYG